MGKKWQPGKAVYSEWLKTLTKEEYEAHLEERRKRKAMKKAMEGVILEKQNEWLSVMNNAAYMLAMKALQEGDTQAFIAVWDRIIGKPKDSIEVDGAIKPLPWNDDFGTPTNEDDDAS